MMCIVASVILIVSGVGSAQGQNLERNSVVRVSEIGDLTLPKPGAHRPISDYRDNQRHLRIEAIDHEVTGRVTEENGEAIPGVNVLVKGTTIGASTDSEGRYSLTAPTPQDTLVFSFVGYLTREIPIAGRSVIDVTLTRDVARMEDVVVVGFGTQRERDVTGSISKVSIEEDFPTTVRSVDELLRGRAPGVQMSNRSGEPGAPINVRIRGVGTPGVNRPLWVIDGLPIVQTNNMTVNTSSSVETNPLAGINPEDIESISILKDASAAAIYGARAANGVILVETKRGQGETTARYSTEFGLQTVRSTRNVLNVDQFIDLQQELGRDFSEFRDESFVDWQDFVYNAAWMQSHELSVSGGGEQGRYFISAGYSDQDGIERAQRFTRYSVRANSSFEVGPFNFGESIQVGKWERLTQSLTAFFSGYQAALNVPFFDIYGDGPNGWNYESISETGGGTAINLGMETDPELQETTVESYKATGSVFGEVELLENLTFRTTGGIDYNKGSGAFFQNNISRDGSSERLSLLVQSSPEELTLNFRNILKYANSFGNHSFDLTAGHEETTFRFDKIRLQGRGLFNTELRFASVAQQISSSNEADHWALRGFFGRVNYNFDDRYLLTANIRRDESSRFSEGNRTGVFPSFSLGWRPTEESFFPNISFLNDLKLRGAWGRAGNQFTGQNFAYISKLQTTIFQPMGEDQEPIRAPAPITFTNRNLSWEVSTQISVGADVRMFDRRLEATIDYFRNTSTDILLGQPIPATSGFFLPTQVNLGKIRNTGLELSLAYVDQVGDLSYSIGGSFTTQNNEVLSLGGAPPIITGIGGEQTHRTIAGEPLGHFYGFKTDGIYQTEEEAEAALPDTRSSGVEPGDIRFVDVNGDGVINDQDRTNIGNPHPDFFYGVTLNGEYKGVDFSAFLQGVGGNQVHNIARQQLENMSSDNNFSTRVLDRWTGPGTSNDMPRATRDDPNGNNRYSDRWVEDAGYLRIQNVQVGYTFSEALLNSISGGVASNFRIYAGIQNLATFTGYKGLDPEVTRAQSFQKGQFPLATGEDDGATPQPRIYQFGVQLTF